MSLTTALHAMRRAPPVENRAGVITLPAGAFPAASYPGAPETTARKLSAVDRCIELLSDSVAKLPSYILDTTTRERPRHPILELLNTRPNEAMTPFVHKKVLETSRLEGGNAYEWIIRDPRTMQPVELVPVPWQLVQPWMDTDGRVWYNIINPRTGENLTVHGMDMCHFKGATRNGILGQSVLARASEVIAGARAAQDYGRRYYESGGQPLGVLETQSDLSGMIQDPTDAKQQIPKKELLRRDWEKYHSGSANAHRIAILDFGLSYKPLSASNKDAQFVEDKEVSIKDIARFFGVPLYKLQEGKQAYGSNEQNSIDYVVSTLHPICTGYEEERTYKLLTQSEIAEGLELRINMMAELKGDTASRGAWYTNMKNNGGFTVNDIRQLEDMPDLEGGDDAQASLNFVPLSQWARLSMQRNGGEL